MALVICPECGGQKSDTSTSCPHCGFRHRSESGQVKTTLICLGVGLLLIGGVIAYIVYDHGAATKGEIEREARQRKFDEVHEEVEGHRRALEAIGPLPERDSNGDFIIKD
jgi:hypothetical protein